MSVRFAPSPTGRFHIGNLRTAWVSRHLARALGLPWIVRFEDIDRPRVVPGAQRLQLEDMARLGLIPDQIVIQSHRDQRHHDLFMRAFQEGHLYPCQCSRKTVAQALDGMASAPHGPVPRYTGQCRNLPSSDSPWSERQNTHLTWRWKSVDSSGKDDFIVARTQGRHCYWAYHWACAIDDAESDHSLLVRAHDLAEAALPQREIQKWMHAMGGRIPALFHTALVTQNDGKRLEKRTHGVTLPELEVQGFSPDHIARVFAESFQAALPPITEGGIYGESKKELSISDLNLSLQLRPAIAKIR